MSVLLVSNSVEKNHTETSERGFTFYNMDRLKEHGNYFTHALVDDLMYCGSMSDADIILQKMRDEIDHMTEYMKKLNGGEMPESFKANFG